MRKAIWIKAASLALALVILLTASISAAPLSGEWVTGDFHTHTYLTDGEKTQTEVVERAFGQYGLDWMANSEHGGAFGRDPFGTAWPSSPVLIPGTPINSNGTVWRWVSIKDYSYPIVQSLRSQYPSNLLFQGVEWNVPSHEHASVIILANEPTAVSDFEYMFDQSDKDTSRAPMPKQNKTHADAVAGAAWLQANYPTTSWFLLNHPSRKLAYTAAQIRDFNNVAPSVAFGLEGLPGHQKEPWRGGYGNNYGDRTFKARTYGGADYMLAQVGGLMDSLWGEGRKFWAFVNSDFHDSADDADFWPGEYAKNYTYVANRNYQSIVDGMRSGNTFPVQGDLINALEFGAMSRTRVAPMGGTLNIAQGDNVTIKIRFRSPTANNCGTQPLVDHIDLIAGDVTPKALPNTPGYSADTNPSTKVIARFTSADWQVVNGWNVITYSMPRAEKSQYFRIRGTNLGLNAPGETDENGNPLLDTPNGNNTREIACGDLWFYSNPVFVAVK